VALSGSRLGYLWCGTGGRTCPARIVFVVGVIKTCGSFAEVVEN